MGFRPFFLAGSGFACLAQVIWGLWLHGAWSSLGLGLSALLGGLAFAVFVAGYARILLTARL
nr:hypothetical protein FFPRI1PSEUD_32030 [Pseudomonas sp. FFPRI_1]